MASPRRRDDGTRPFIWALLGSTAFHFLWIVLLAWLAARFFVMPKPATEAMVVTSTSLDVKPHTIPQPRTAAAAHHEPVKGAASSAAHRPTPTTQQPQPPHELAREDAQATPQPPQRRISGHKVTLGEQLAQQQHEFSREVAQLNASNNPRSIATIAPEAPGAYQKSYYDLNGKTQAEEGVTVLLTPSSHWYSGSDSCYYVQYSAEYTEGGTDEGNIPWPVCYPRINDPIARSNGMSVPVPAPSPKANYVLPPGTYLTPLMRHIYDSNHHATPPPRPE